eukprot:COSAG06_NODE_4567_length_4140_cov_2.536996_5_plen_106_part_00
MGCQDRLQIYIAETRTKKIVFSPVPTHAGAGRLALLCDSLVHHHLHDRFAHLRLLGGRRLRQHAKANGKVLGRDCRMVLADVVWREDSVKKEVRLAVNLCKTAPL